MYKSKIKITLILIVLVSILAIFPSVVKAADDTTYTSTSTINGVTVNWSYELNETNEIINLKCTNPAEMTGNITIPSNLDGKTVVTLGDKAFETATGITSVTIPSSVKQIGLWAFRDCTSLSSINLGSVEKIAGYAFEGCTSLTSVTIPKTLKSTGLNQPVFSENLNTITFEEGLTIIPQALCAETKITEVTIPSSVKEIDLWAFRDCASLSSINLGSVEKIAGYAFEGCTSLTSVTIPKTLKSTGLNQPVFSENLNTITFEEGLTIIPQALCAETKITEVTIPSSVKEIDLWAFRDCADLKKITILDNVIDMSDSLEEDKVFENHNSDLTIYCYKDSVAANYAIKYNIKYVYLTKPVTDNNEENKNDEEKPKEEIPNSTEPTQKPTTDTDKEDTTTATGKLPQTGLSMGISLAIVVLLAGCVFAYFKYNKLRGI